MPHREYLQFVNYNISYTTGGNNILDLFDIPMPLCGPKEICNIKGVTTVFDGSATGVRWRLWLSLEPKDRFLNTNVHTQTMNDVFYYKVHWNIANVTSSDMNHTIMYPDPIAYPYDKMRMAVTQSGTGAGATWNVIIYYTIEPIEPKQLTAITIRRGTVKHAREQGPEP